MSADWNRVVTGRIESGAGELERRPGELRIRVAEGDERLEEQS